MRVLLLLLLISVISCSDNYQSTIVHKKDLVKSETIVLQSRCGDQVVSINIEGVGNTSGSSSIRLILNDRIYKSKDLMGDFKFNWSGDWYSDKAIVKYEAGTGSTTNLVLSYRMECI